MRIATVVVLTFVFAPFAGAQVPDNFAPSSCEVPTPPQTGELDPRLQATVSQLQSDVDQLARAERRGDTRQQTVYRTRVVNTTRVIREQLGPERFAELVDQLHSGPATWGRGEVEHGLDTGLTVGR